MDSRRGLYDQLDASDELVMSVYRLYVLLW